MKQYPQYDFQEFAEEARECPLCGSRNVVTNKREYEEDKHRIGQRYYATIKCDDCGLHYIGEGRDDYETAYATALAHWNTRAGEKHDE